MGERPYHAEAFSIGAGPPPQREKRLVGLLTLFVAVDLDVEAFLSSSPRRSVSGLRRVAQHSTLIAVPDRLDVPRPDAPVARSKPTQKHRLEFRRLASRQNGQCR